MKSKPEELSMQDMPWPVMKGEKGLLKDSIMETVDSFFKMLNLAPSTLSYVIHRSESSLMIKIEIKPTQQPTEPSKTQ